MLSIGARNYPLIKKQELIKKAEQYTTENALKGWLPQVNITAQATYQNDVTQFPVKLPKRECRTSQQRPIQSFCRRFTNHLRWWKY